MRGGFGKIGGLLAGGAALMAALAPAAIGADAQTPPPLELPNYGFTYAVDTCTRMERWSYGPTIAREHRERLEEYLVGESSPPYGLASGVILAEQGPPAAKGAKPVKPAPEQALLGKYLQGRAYWDAELVHLAREVWDEVIAAPVTDATQGVQTAALECLNRLHRRYPSIPSSEALDRTLPKLLAQAQASGWRGANLSVIHDAAEMQIRSRLGPGAPTEAESLLALLDGGGAFRSLARGLWHAHRKEWAPAVKELEEFAAVKPRDLPESLKAYRDEALLTLARAYELDGKHAEAIERLKQVEKESNYTVRALNELAWNHLMRDDYANATGVAVNLSKGGFGKTFSPEALVILAMTFNELCQFPQSFRSIRLFYRRYRTTHDWLTGWYQRRQKREVVPLYPSLLAFVKDEKTAVPPQVSGEWVRSPVFAAAQDELNLLIDELERVRKFRRRQYEETMSLFKRAREVNLAVRAELKSATPERKRDPAFRDSVRARYAEAARLKLQYSGFRRAVASFRAAQTELEKLAPTRRQFLVEQVERDLAARNIRMLNRLRELIETAYLVQVEIYNGASEDIVWRNANPEYGKFLDKLKKESKESSATQEWNWGSVRDVSDEGGEVWEDELDSMRAKLTDNCANRDKFMAVSMQEAQKREEEAARIIVGDAPGKPEKTPAPAGQ